MARIRTIKPAAFSSESLAAVSVSARWTFAGIWTYVDDEGRGKADPRLIKAHVWPLDDGVLVEDIEGFIDELEKERMVQRYRVDGREYLAVVNWHDHQRINRPTASQIPAPECSFTKAAKEVEPSVRPHGVLTEETRWEGKGREVEGKGEYSSAELTAISYPADFEEFWAAYPRKVGKTDSLRVWQSMRKKVAVGVMLTGAKKYRDDPNREDQFTAHPATWLRRGGWDDEPLPAKGRVRSADPIGFAR